MKKFTKFACMLLVAGSIIGLNSCKDKGEDPVAPKAPTELAYSNVQDVSAVLTWAGETTAYEVSIDEGASIPVNGKTYTVNGLTPETEYKWRVRAKSGDLFSEWVDGPAFTTLEEIILPDAPTNLAYSDVTETSATFTWEGTTTSYEIEVGDDITSIVDEKTFSTDALSPGSTYDWRVRAKDGDLYSPWVDGDEFTTEGESNIIFDDFESHAEFTINSPGTVGWSYIDADGAGTYGFEQLEFPNNFEPMACIIFNPYAIDGLDPQEGMEPVSGEQFVAFWDAAGPVGSVPQTDDYMISPELNFDGTSKIAFWAKSNTVQYGAERFVVAYSTDGKTAADFTNVVSEGEYVEVPEEWTRYEYEIPAGAKYVTLHCVSHDAMFLMVDDIAIGQGTLPNTAPPAAVQASDFTVWAIKGMKR